MIECEIPSLKIAIDILPETLELEKHLVCLENLDEKRWDGILALDINKCRFKDQYDNYVCPCSLNECDLVLLYDKASELLGEGMFNPM